MTQPAHDVQVSPLEELKLKAELEDDFGVVRHGLSYSMAGHEPRRSSCQVAAAKTRQLRPEHMLDFESLQCRARPASHLLLLGRGHRPGRPAAADIRRYVLRRSPAVRGDLPPGRTAPERLGRERRARGQQGNAQASDQLAELQKEIINGTWKLIRRETGPSRPTSSPRTARSCKSRKQRRSSRRRQLAERLQDAASKANLEQATRSMKDAEKHLAEVAAELVDGRPQPGPGRRAGGLSGAAQAACTRIRGDPQQLAAATAKRP